VNKSTLLAAVVATSTFTATVSTYRSSEPVSFIASDTQDGTKTLYLDKKGIADSKIICVNEQILWMENDLGSLQKIKRLCVVPDSQNGVK